MKKKYEIQFDRYTNKFDMSNKEIHFKYLHSYRVEELMKKLSDKLYLNEENKEFLKGFRMIYQSIIWYCFLKNLFGRENKT